MQRTFNKAERKPYFRSGNLGLGVNKNLGWTPSLITTAMWLDAADNSTFTKPSGIVEWRDKSGNGRNVQQLTAANQPSLISKGRNGLDVVRFGGTQWFTHSYSPGSTITLFTVARTTVTTGYRCLGIFGANLNLYINYNNAFWGHFNSGDSGFSAASFSIIYIERSTSIFYRQNGSSEVTKTLTTSTAANFIGKASSSAAPEAMVGDLAELILIASTPSTSDRQKIEGYLAWKWGLVAELPADHPYRNNAPLA